MTLSEAYELMDLLLDKSDQPYFTTDEKNKFLDLAITDFVNFHYQKMTADEDSRRAMSPLIDWTAFRLSETEIVSGSFIYNSRFPALSVKYDLGTSTDLKGYFTFGTQYVLPKQHLYMIAMSVRYYNIDDIINPNDGTALAGVDETDVIFTPSVSIKNKSTRDYYEDTYSGDPFNKVDDKSPSWTYLENRILIQPSEHIADITMQTLMLPTIDQAFSSSSATVKLTFAEHHQKQIVELAVSKMTKVDVGLMTPPSQ